MNKSMRMPTPRLLMELMIVAAVLLIATFLTTTSICPTAPPERILAVEWQRLSDSGYAAGSTVVMRTRVPGGWLISFRSADGTAAAVVSDANGAWLAPNK